MAFFPLNSQQISKIQENVIYQFGSDAIKFVLGAIGLILLNFLKNKLPAKSFLSFLRPLKKIPIYSQDYLSQSSFDRRIVDPLNDVLEFLLKFGMRGKAMIASSDTNTKVDWDNGFITIGIPQYNPLINNIVETYPELFYVPSKFLDIGFITGSDFRISSTSKDFTGGSRRKSLGVILKVKNPDTKKMCLIITGNSIYSIKLASVALNKYWRYLFKRYGSSEFGCVFKSSHENMEIPVLISASKPKINIFSRLWFAIIGSIISIGNPKINIKWSKTYF